MGTKWRLIDGPRKELSEQFVNNAPSTTFNSLNHELQVTTSEGHPYFRLGNRFGFEDIGGPFQTQKLSLRLDEDHVQTVNAWWQSWANAWLYSTNTVLLPSVEFWEQTRNLANATTEEGAKRHLATYCPPLLSSPELDALGAIAVDRVQPTNPVVDLSMSIGEFISERKFFAVPGTAGSLPGEYLNYMFGISPTIADLMDLRSAIHDQEKIVKQYQRDAGRRLRRRYEFDKVRKVDQTTRPNRVYSMGAPLNTYQAQEGTLTKHIVTENRTWFSGAFTYYLPEDIGMRRMAILDKLYGVNPGAALTWELLPFSWLVDYKLNIGSVMSNIDAFTKDGLIMPYGYIMSETKVTEYHEWRGYVNDSAGVPVHRVVSGSIERVIKQRQPANPFGFGLKPGDLTARQLSILAALGLTLRDRR